MEFSKGNDFAQKTNMLLLVGSKLFSLARKPNLIPFEHR